MIAFFENGKFEVNDHSDPDLDLYRIGGSAIEGLDSEVLFDPFEEQFDFPSCLVKGGKSFRRKCEVVG